MHTPLKLFVKIQTFMPFHMALVISYAVLEHPINDKLRTVDTVLLSSVTGSLQFIAKTKAGCSLWLLTRQGKAIKRVFMYKEFHRGHSEKVDKMESNCLFLIVPIQTCPESSGFYVPIADNHIYPMYVVMTHKLTSFPPGYGLPCHKALHPQRPGH